MNRYVCTVCGYVYDEAKGMPEAGIALGTKWDGLPVDWVCPVCGASKSEFTLQTNEPKADAQKKTVVKIEETQNEFHELNFMEMSALCSNLARGCEKQYQPAQAQAFLELATYFKNNAEPEKDASFEELLLLIESDLNDGFTRANAEAVADRGALRALVWSEKVTRIQKSLLARYKKEGEAMLEKTGVYVCTICGFIFVGDNPPELCPVCKVPGWKFIKVEGRET